MEISSHNGCRLSRREITNWSKWKRWENVEVANQISKPIPSIKPRGYWLNIFPMLSRPRWSLCQTKLNFPAADFSMSGALFFNSPAKDHRKISSDHLKMFFISGISPTSVYFWNFCVSPEEFYENLRSLSQDI